MDNKNLTVAIMAGGKSSRMGTDKSFVPFFGKPLIEHVLPRINQLGAERIIISNKPEEYSYLGLAVYRDIYQGKGPLAGLHSALSNARQDNVLIVACDMPWLNQSLLKYMIALSGSADAIIPLWNNHPEPLHAIYGKTCLDPIELALQSDDLKMTAFHKSVNIHFLDQKDIKRFDPQGKSFSNLNTPEDLSSALFD